MHDFRRLPGQVAGTETPELRYEIRKAAGRREVGLELRGGLGWEVQPFRHTATLDDDPESVGLRTREILDISLGEQFSWAPGYDSFNRWRAAIEYHDVLVCQMTDVETEESRGFSLAEELLPVISVNIKDPPTARCFSLLHEFTHLLLRQGGLCDFDDHSQRPAEDLRAERFCNQSSAAALMPQRPLLEEGLVQRYKPGSDWEDSDVRDLANKYGVSREALVRRLLTLGRVSEKFYRGKRAQYHEDYARARAERRPGFAPPDRIALSAAGPSFARTVLESYYQERITASSLSDYLDVRLKHIPAIEAALASAVGAE